MASNPSFGTNTKGADIIEAFPSNVQKKTFVLTGMGQSDLAAATADALASGDPAALILLGRSQTEIQPVFEAINNKYPKVKVIFITVDVCKLSSVRGATEVIKKLEVPIDGIIGFPMVMAGEWATTKDGIESHFQINYLTHFVLVNRLLGMIPEEGRVVLVSSSIRPDAMAFRFDDTNFSNGKTYHPLDGYAQSVFACVQFTKGLAASGSARPVSAFSVNPGNTKTNLHTCVSQEQVASWLQRKKEVKEDLPLLLQQAPKSISQGSATVLKALLDPNLKAQSGSFLDNCQVRSLPHIDFPAGEEAAKHLWKKTEEILGEEFKRF